MNGEAAERLALERLVTVSASLEAQLERSPVLQPIAAILSIARENAAIATSGLVFQDPKDIDKVREFQFEIRRYDDLVDFIRTILVNGREADRRLSEQDRAEFDRLAFDPEIQAERDQLRGERAQED